ncbi:MAG: hypothetical protein KF889_04850 [Alphaproteobacteria bacterium]|nr:hypothetical protein [Alphaproteobacteria bacterium]MCW5742197.1 hypothetical protein [Alphaproteobacteria bacterium]
MKLPRGVKITEPNRQALGYIFDRLRPDDLDEYQRMNPDTYGRDHFIDAWLKLTEAFIVRVHGRPALVFGMNVLPHVVYLVAQGTEVVDQYGIAMTRAARGYLGWIRSEYPLHRIHIAPSVTHTGIRRWLERLGCVDTQVRLRRGRGELALMEAR